MIALAFCLAVVVFIVWLFVWMAVAQAIVRIGIPHERWWSMPLAFALFLPWGFAGLFGAAVAVAAPFVFLGIMSLTP